MDVSFKVNTMAETIEKTEKRKNSEYSQENPVYSRTLNSLVEYIIGSETTCVQKELHKPGCYDSKDYAKLVQVYNSNCDTNYTTKNIPADFLSHDLVKSKKHHKLAKKESKLYPNLIKAMKDPTNEFNGLVPRPQGSYTPQGSDSPVRSKKRAKKSSKNSI